MWGVNMGRRMLSFAVSATCALALSSAAIAQESNHWNDRDARASRQEHREQHKCYDHGFKDGVKDRKHHHPLQIRDIKFDDRADREAYMEGYRAGYDSGVYRY